MLDTLEPFELLSITEADTGIADITMPLGGDRENAPHTYQPVDDVSAFSFLTKTPYARVPSPFEERIKDLEAKIAELEAKNARLEAENQELRAELQEYPSGSKTRRSIKPWNLRSKLHEYAQEKILRSKAQNLAEAGK